MSVWPRYDDVTSFHVRAEVRKDACILSPTMASKIRSEIQSCELFRSILVNEKIGVIIQEL